ncbi:cell division control protein 2 homolog 1-like [Nilaparvata lugens]|uniref:cell division control protein 2 homolog 1-like n=1 Tax=Nilaparvata lugens TaxID=108931 RepID=UPI00193D426E|nr:cell division control protein 2 homolog 1-like [Nilaparvata lugens]
MLPASPTSKEYLSTVTTSSPDKYEIMGKITEGAYGMILKAYNKEDKDAGFFAIKTNRHKGYEGVVTVNDYIEVKALMKLKNERNIVHLIELVQDEERFGMVLELCKADIGDILHNRRISLPMCDIKLILKEILTGVRAIHRQNIFHRDIKPQNILLSLDGTVKITDFGNSMDKGMEEYDPNCCTIWYKSPELCFGHTHYNEKIDIWSVGCLAVECWKRTIFFRGEDDMTHMEKVSEVCGFCDESEWPEVKEFPNYAQMSEAFGSKFKENKLETCLIHLTRHTGAAKFLCKLIKLTPSKRLTAAEALDDPFFQSVPAPSNDLSNVIAALNNLQLPGIE